MSCQTGAIQNLINDCATAPIAGLEEVIYMFNASELTATKSLTTKTLVTDLTVLPTKKGFKLQGFKKSNNAKNELTVTDTLPDQFKQTIDFTIWAKDALTVAQLVDLNDMVFVVENKDKGVDGASAFNIYGLDSSLYKVSMTQEANADAGVFKLSMAAEGQSVPFYNLYDTSYAVTKAMLEALLTVQV